MNGKIMLNGKAYSSSGRPSREITYAQWQALPDTKYTDGIVYYIKDVGGANQFPPLIYSDEEREIGVWRDGKPLYQKSWKLTIPNQSGYYLFPNTDMSDLDKVCDCWWSLDGQGMVQATPWYSQAGIYLESHKTAGIGFYFSSTFRANSIIYYTALYTKTTDTPGSGTWTNDGTYAKHYSTTEHIIGTWIDGKPIYERTDTFTNSSGISGEVNLMAIDSTWRLIDAKVHVYNSSNQRTYFFPYMTSAYDSIMVSNGYLKLVSNDSWGSAYSPFYITIQYTKTTD